MKSSPDSVATASEATGTTNRERILHAAIEVFGRQGLEGGRTREIAKRAGVTQPLLMYHFKDKLTLWNECAEYIFSDFSARITSRLASEEASPIATQLAALIRELIGSAARNSDAHRFMIRYSIIQQPPPAKKASRGSARTTAKKDPWVKQIRRAQRQGVLPSGIDPFILRFMLVGAATYAYLESESFEQLTGRDPHSKDIAEKHVQAMVKVFLGSAANS